MASPHALILRLLLALSIAVSGCVSVAAAGVDYNRDVQPILSENCYHCHGPDAASREAKLRLDVEEEAVRKNEDGVAIIERGNPDASELIVRILSTDRDEVMPTPKSHRTLTAQQKEILKRWVAEGAPWGRHWAFVPPQRPPVPQTPQGGNAIDGFVAARLHAEGLTMAGQAPREELIRRAALDLTGLPPTPEEINAFVKDTRPDAYEQLVDRLLASPRYGERMVWEWLDAARYADTNGYQGDPTRAMWHWRDWAIRALNENMPFDQFTIEQLAGDLLPKPSQDQLIATGFHRNHMINGEGGRIPEESRVEYVQDRVETTGTVWMGLTLNCCRCHDHKYDQLSQAEYYRLSAFFNSIDESGAKDADTFAKPVLSLASAEDEAKIKQAKDAETEANRERDELEKQLRAEQPAWEAALAGDGAVKGEVEWQLLKVDEAISENGATLTKLPDGSVLASGKNPETDDIVITAITQVQNVSGLKLEVMTDDTLAQKGPGRAENGSWVLTEVKMLGDGRPVGLATVRADFEQPGWPLKNVLDGKGDTGWGAWPEVGKPHEAIFELLDAFGYRQDRVISLRLQFHSQYKQHVIGKFRLWITNSPAALLRPIPDAAREALTIAPEQRTDAHKKAITDYYLASNPRLIAAKKKADAAKEARTSREKASPRTMVMRDREKLRDTFILVKGAYDKYGEKVEHGTPAVLPPLPLDAPKNRLALAQWLVSPGHPLTARVTVNRYWQMFFGRGLVKTVEDFGVQGDKPSHPELLDWLAREFIESGWNVKHIHRLIVTSAAYRQESKVPPGMAERDPENALLARGPRFRMPSWMLRDQALSIAGLLVEKTGGPPVKVYQPAGVWEDATFGQIKYQQDRGEALYRRSLYIFWRRIIAPPLFFDTANRQNCAVRVGRTNTPLQALVTLNDVTYVEAARVLAERVLQSGGADDASRLAYAFRLCTARFPSAREADLLAASLQRFRQTYATDESAAQKLIATGEAKPTGDFPPTELAAHTSVALLLLNLDETLTKE